eukprot:Opistho-2@95459
MFARTAIFLALVGFALAAPFQVGDIWTPCTATGDHFTPTNVVITPASPVKGQPLTVAVNGTLDESVTGGSVEIVIKYLGISIVNEKKDLCTLDSAHPCPFAQGVFSLTEGATIPSIAPSGTYKGTVKLSDQNGQEIYCVNLDFKL